MLMKFGLDTQYIHIYPVIMLVVRFPQQAGLYECPWTQISNNILVYSFPVTDRSSLMCSTNELSTSISPSIKPASAVAMINVTKTTKGEPRSDIMTFKMAIMMVAFPHTGSDVTIHGTNANSVLSVIKK